MRQFHGRSNDEMGSQAAPASEPARTCLAKASQGQAKGKPIVGPLEIAEVLKSFVILSNFSFSHQFHGLFNDTTGS